MADFVGLANFIEGQIVDRHHVRVDGTVVAVDRPLEKVGPVVLVIRPEMIRLISAVESGAENLLHGHIAASAFLGGLTRYWVSANGAEWVVDVPAPGSQTLRGEVGLLLPRDHIHVLRE